MRRLSMALVAVVAILSGQAESSVDEAPLRIAWLHDSERHAAANRAQHNYWDSYVREILDELGLRAEEVSPDVLGDAERLARYATLLIGELDTRDISTTARHNLDRWVRSGGRLIAFATDGVEDLCGNRHVGRIAQTGDPFTCSATFALRPLPLTQEIHSPLQPEQRLLIFSDAQKVLPVQSDELARLYDSSGQDTGCAAVTARALGKGQVFYFAFSVPQTVWVLHQGRPVDRDYDGDEKLRRSDAIVIRPHSTTVPYADELLFLLQNMIGTQPHAFIHQLPPISPTASSLGQPPARISHETGTPTTPCELKPDAQAKELANLTSLVLQASMGGEKFGPAGSRIPDALFHWGGDDEGDQAGIQLAASNWMREHGLPYHINAMPRKDGTFGLCFDEAEAIRANGHEISLHFNFVDGFGPGTGFTRDHVAAQAAAFRRHFGTDWTCSVNHHTRWTGWAEPAKWMREMGGKADNTFVHAPSPPSNPVNQFGFSFGTALPFWFYDDWRGGNSPIDFLEVPITAYECGYSGKEQTDFETVHRVIDLAARYHLTMNMFYHPIYITDYPACRAAIEEALRYLDERRIQALHMGSDELYCWWRARSQAHVSATTVERDALGFEVECNYAAGVIVKVPLGGRVAQSVIINGVSESSRFKCEQRFGQNWVLVAVPRGKNLVKVMVQ